MNVVLLTIMCTLALPHGSNAMIHNPSRSSKIEKFNDHPCQENSNNNAFNTFLWRHILQEDFNRNSWEQWEQYLKKKRLCHRPEQSFIMKNNKDAVVQICNGSGRRVYGNLCISDSIFEVYDIKVNINSCKVESLVRGTKHVIVACDKINNMCLPVHFQKYMNQEGTAERCHG